METNLPVIAGAISTTIFALSTLPMLVKAFRTKDLKSYSLGNILLAVLLSDMVDNSFSALESGKWGFYRMRTF